MSNYPSPYPQYPQPPQGPQGPHPYGQGYYGYQDPVAQLTGRCKRAGILQIVLASLGLLCGGCLAAVAPFMTLETFTRAGYPVPAGLDLELIQRIYLVGGIILVVLGIVLIILGALIIRGSRGAAITSLVIAGIGALVALLGTGVGLAQQRPAEGLVYLATFALIAWLIVWQIQASSAAGQIAAARAQSSYFPQGQPGYGYPYGQPSQQQQPWTGQQQQQWPPQPQHPPQQQHQWPPPPQPPQQPPP